MSTQPESTLSPALQEELVELRAEQAAEAADDYTEFVLGVSQGDDFDEISGEAILSAAQKTHDDFQRDLQAVNGQANRRWFTEMLYQAKVTALASRVQTN